MLPVKCINNKIHLVCDLCFSLIFHVFTHTGGKEKAEINRGDNIREASSRKFESKCYLVCKLAGKEKYRWWCSSKENQQAKRSNQKRRKIDWCLFVFVYEKKT